MSCKTSLSPVLWLLPLGTRKDSPGTARTRHVATDLRLQQRLERALTDGESDKTILKTESAQIKDMFRKTITEAEEERNALASTLELVRAEKLESAATYKRQMAELTETVKQLQAKDALAEADADMVTLQRTVHDTELQMAQVKLQLVESECRVQMLEQQLKSAESSPEEGKKKNALSQWFNKRKESTS